MRSRSRAAKAGSGASRTSGRRNTWNGSVISTAAASFIRTPERRARSHDQCLGGMPGTAEFGCNLGYRQVIEIAQHKHAAVLWRQHAQCLLRTQRVKPLFPGVLDRSGDAVASYEMPLLA